MSDARSPRSKLSAKVPIAIAMVTVLASLVASLWLAHRRSAPPEAPVRTIAQTAAPAIAHLAELREDLRHLAMAAYEHVTDPPGSRRRIDEIRMRISAEIAACEALPMSNDGDVLSPILRELPGLDAAVAHLLDRIDASDQAGARRALYGDVHPAIDRVDGAIEEAQQRALKLAETHAAKLAERRRGGHDLAVVLGGLSVIGVIVAGTFAFLALRRHGGLIAAHGRLLDARESELEAFAGRVAHDLRNPLNALVLRIETMRVRQPEEAEALDKLSAQAKRMDRVIEGLLDYATAGAHPPGEAHADLREVLDDAIADVQPAIENAQAELRVSPFEPVEVACAPGALTSVLTNLIANAAKYIIDAPSGIRAIEVRVERRDGRVRVEVADTGPCLPAGTPHEVVFEPFHHFPSARHPGFGLGLATVKKIVEAYGGTIGVISRPGSGCTFWFELPAK